MTMKDDLVNRSPDIHWPAAFDPAKADLFAHNELVINAPCERVWRHITEPAKWPEWYPNSGCALPRERFSSFAGMLAIDAATTAAVRADREARFFTICSSYAPILNQRREISR